MKHLTLALTAAVVFTGLSIGAAFAAGPDTMYGDSSLGKVLTDAKGMTLYNYDPDKKTAPMGYSACTGKCLVNWPPFLAAADAAAAGDWTLVRVVSDADGKTNVMDASGKPEMMWAYEGMPLYYWINDKKAGDVDGDGKGGVWHVIKQD